MARPALAAFVVAIAALADKLVDAMARPETVMRAMQRGQFGRQAHASGGAPDASRAPIVPDPQPKWDWVRVGSDNLVAYRQGDPDEDARGVLRSGVEPEGHQ